VGLARRAAGLGRDVERAGVDLRRAADVRREAELLEQQDRVPAGVDLQRRVHEDMTRAFSAYPRSWGLSAPDANIDHRRVPNLQTYFRRRGVALPVTRAMSDYVPGDVVTWMLPGNLPHIGLVTDRRSADGARPLMVHNIGRGPELEDMILGFPITGHYRYRGE